MAGYYKFNGKEAMQMVEREFGKRLDASAIITLNRSRQLLNVEGTAKSSGGRRGKLIYGANRSKPGEPPRKQTGRLLGSMAWERNGLVARVGSNLIYSRPLEITMNRPYLQRALNEVTPQIQGLLSKPMSF